MDKKNTTIGIVLLIAAFVMMYQTSKTPQPRQPQPQPAPQTANGTPAQTPGAATGTPPQTTIGPSVENPNQAATPAAAAASSQPVAFQSAPASQTALFAPLSEPRADEQFTTITNDLVSVRFTNYGGAIADVALALHPKNKDGTEPLVLNEERHAPILAFTRLAGADADTAYERVSADGANPVIYRTVLGGQLELTRTYTVSTGASSQDRYVIRAETTVRNLGTAPIPAARVALNLGTERLVHETDDTHYLQTGRYDGEDLHLTARDALAASGGFLGMGAHGAYAYYENLGPTVWATVENQFFVTIIVPKTAASGLIARRVELTAPVSGVAGRYGLTSDLYVDTRTIPAGGSDSYAFDVYAGPKEFKRLERLGQDLDEVMQWGWFSFFAKLLLVLMTWLHQLVASSAWSWGWAIILTTVVIRVAMWPLTGMSTRAAKRMAKIQGPLKELQEKYKDNRQKLTEETMKLWKLHKVNPLAGCLPLLAQMPIFIGLFSMLRSASELRFGEFLWVTDLSAPDTVVRIPLGLFTLPLNPMPILMGVTSLIQMRMTPTPTTDNPSAKMMKFMPILFTVLCYNFSSGLSLYWTCSNCFSIFQQWVTNRRKEPVEPTPAVKPGAVERAKPIKDAKVTTVPKKKK